MFVGLQTPLTIIYIYSYISTKMRLLIMEARLGHPALVAAVPRYQHLGTDAEQTW